MIVVNGHFAKGLDVRLSAFAPVVQYHEATASDLKQATVLLTRGGLRVDKGILDRLPLLRLIVKAGSGLDTIDLTATEAAGVEVFATGGSEQSVAELALALLLACRRGIVAFDRAVRAADWEAKSRLVAGNIRGSSVGIVGFGRIGRSFGAMVAALGADVVFWDRSPEAVVKREAAEQLGARHVRDLHELLGEVDILSLHAPPTPETIGMIGAAEFAAMRCGSILINTARAELVVREPLIAALRSGQLSSAGLDVHYEEGAAVFDPDLDLLNVVLTPHVGAQSHGAHRRIGEIALERVAKEFARRRGVEH